ncbi:MAG: TerD family protein [Oscillospiraceae bacterium]
MVNLTKGQKISLTKESSGLKNVMVALGWDEAEIQPVKFSLFSRKPKQHSIDCDASAILLDENGKCIDNSDVIYFGNLTHKSGTVKHQGDNLTGEGDGDDEQILVDLANLPSKYCKIAFVVTIYKADERNQNFGMIKNAYIRIVDTSNGNKELCKFNLSDDINYNDKTSMLFGELYRHNGEWKFNAIGEGLYSVGISNIVNQNYR